MGQLTYDVVEYQGSVSYRAVPTNSTTVYMDTVLATFNTEQEALDYLDELQKEGYTDEHDYVVGYQE